MSLKHGLLGIISCDGSMTGYELDKFFKNSLAFFWQAKTSQIYRELSAMETQGWLTSERVLQEEKPNKRVYSVTPQGREEFLSWLTDSDVGLSGAKSSYLMKIFFSGEVGKEQALRLIHEYKKKCETLSQSIAEILSMNERENVNDEYPRHATYWKLTALHGESIYKAGIEWANKAIAILEEEVE